MALFFVLNSPELEILGITTVAGNRSLNVATADVLKVLEVTNRTEIPVFQGAAAPLLHQGTEWDTKRHGGWYANEPAPRAARWVRDRQEARSAERRRLPGRARVMQNPGQVTILAIGPLTNIAMAMRMEPQLRRQRQAAGDHGRRHRLAARRRRQPHAERRVQLLRRSRSGADRAALGHPDRAVAAERVAQGAGSPRTSYDKIVAVDTPITRLVKENLGPGYQQRPDRVALMYDQVAAVALVAPHADQDGGAVRGRRHQSRRQLRRLGRRAADLARRRRRAQDAGPDRPRLGQVHPACTWSG